MNSTITITSLGVIGDVLANPFKTTLQIATARFMVRLLYDMTRKVCGLNK